MITEEKRRKITIFDETISHPESKLYPRIYGDCKSFIMYNCENNISRENVSYGGGGGGGGLLARIQKTRLQLTDRFEI